MSLADWYLLAAPWLWPATLAAGLIAGMVLTGAGERALTNAMRQQLVDLRERHARCPDQLAPGCAELRACRGFLTGDGAS